MIGANKNGIRTSCNNTLIDSNTISDIALLSRLTASGLGDECCSGLGIEANGNDLIISRNAIDNIGYIGIRNNGSALIEYNHISNCCLSKDDGAGIYTGWQSDTFATGSAGTLIRRNIVLATQCANNGTPHPAYFPGQGIYIDDYGHDITIDENTVTGCVDRGIFLHNTRRITTQNNTLVNNLRHQVAYGENPYPNKYIQMADNIFTGNRLISFSASQCLFTATSAFPEESNFGQWDLNLYWNPFTKTVFTYRNNIYTLPEWQSYSGNDLGSTIAGGSTPIFWHPWIIKDTVGANLIKNGTFSTGNISGWSVWPSTSTISCDTIASLDGGTLRAFTPYDGTNQPLIISNTFAVKKDHHYLLKFSSVASKRGQLTPVLRQSYSPWLSRAATQKIAIGQQREDTEILFTATANDSPCRIDFNPGHEDSLFWIDNISLHEVNSDTFPVQERVFLFLNPSFKDSTIYPPAGSKALDGTTAPYSLQLAPFTSFICYLDPSTENEGHSPHAIGEILTTYPNPFNPSVFIKVNEIINQNFSLKVFNLQGKMVVDLTPLAKNGTVEWKADKMPSGIYCIKYSSPTNSITHKVTLLK